MSVPSIRPYQAEALEFLVKHERAALWDEPGLGKTMMSLLAMRDLEPRGRILVVATGDATGVWQDEINFWLDEGSGVYSGLKPSEDELDRPHGFVITNYHRLANVLSRRIQWDGVIFDESQMLRNRNTTTLFKSVRHYFDRARYGLGGIPAFFLSGTPIVKAAGDIWPILHLIDRKRWNAFWPFVQKYSIFWQDQFGWHTEGVTNAKGLWEETSSVSLRRTVEVAQPWLPPKVRQRVPLTMTPKQARAYRDLERDMYAEVDDGSLLLAPSALAAETRLRQLLVCPRLLGIEDDGAALLALRDIATSHRRPLVVFTPFPSAFPFVEAALLRTGRPMYRVRGGMGERFRESVDLFNRAAKEGSGPILLASVEMAKGWSVAKSTHECYMLEFDWNETAMKQAESRLHRDGQEDTVFSRYFVHEGTHDFDALDVLAGKRRLADVILDRKHKIRRRHA